MYKCFIPIEPYPKRTGTFSMNTGRFFANSKTKKFEKSVSDFLMLKFGGILFEKNDPLKLEVVFRMKRPKTVKRDKPIVKPDLSNLIKSFEDALGKSIIFGDQQIVKLMCSKVYAESEADVGINMILSKE